MSRDYRPLAVAIAGFCAFINLYAPQSLLPALAREFTVGAADISRIITASTIAVALTAPFTGAIADVLGRKRLITTAMFAVAVPTLLMPLAPSVDALAALRFIQGLMLPPPIFAVTVAYIGDEWPPSQVARIAGYYIGGSSLGGFAGRFITGVLDDLVGWRGAFLALAMLSLVGAVAIALMLPREKNFKRSEGFAASLRQMLQHFRNRQLLATYAVGFGVLFNFLAVFTYISFHLAAPPYNFSSTLLGAIFFTYLVGTVCSPWIGWAVTTFGRRKLILGIVAIWTVGVLLTLLPQVAGIIVGLTLCAACGMICQGVSTGYVTETAKVGRSSAVGLYVTSFYVGGSLGAFLPGFIYESFGWPAVVALALAVLFIMASIVALFWPRRPARA